MSTPREDIERRVKQIVSEQTGINVLAFTLESGFIADLGCDSLDDIEIVMSVENEFAIEIPDDMGQSLTVTDEGRFSSQDVEDEDDLVELVAEAPLPTPAEARESADAALTDFEGIAQAQRNFAAAQPTAGELAERLGRVSAGLRGGMPTKVVLGTGHVFLAPTAGLSTEAHQSFAEAAEDEAHPYHLLSEVLLRAFAQAANGKGKERHAKGDTPFHEQPMALINKQIGSVDGFIYQAHKKSLEALRLPQGRNVAELLGAINYLAGAVIALESWAQKEGGGS
jgi:acyl carrier protein